MMNKDEGWIEWRGGACPVDSKTLVEVVFRGSAEVHPAEPADVWYWPHDGGPSDIAYYRLAGAPAKKDGLAESPLDVQVAGDHYKKLKIQPIEYIHANGIPFAEGSAIKYLTRWRDKGGIKDLEKARHFIDLLIELETRNGGQQ